MAAPVIDKILQEKLKIKPARFHELVYDSSSETLEPIYFWILDFMNDMFGGNVEKLVDNFSSSPGGGHFLEMSQRKTFLQDQVQKNLGAINQTMRAVVNLVYDLKDFEIRLKHYEDAKSDDKEIKEAGILALKQIWMDNVDIKRGVGSINQLTSGNLQFVTLRDAFMSAKDVKDVDKLDLNERVKRILKPRISEFVEWRKLSEDELRKRFSIEKNYLKSQANTLRLYARWIKPYLKSAAELEGDQDTDRNPSIISTFNTNITQLTLLGKSEVNVQQAILDTDLPNGIKIPKRKYFPILIVDFFFRGIPQKSGQHFVFGGRVEVKITGYCINENEMAILNQELEKSEFHDVMKLVQGSTTESLDELQKDIDYFLKDDKENNKPVENVNPFAALFSFGKKSKKKEEKSSKALTIKGIKKDSYSESLVRALGTKSAAENCFSLFDIYKKAHGMPSHDNPWE